MNCRSRRFGSVALRVLFPSILLVIVPQALGFSLRADGNRVHGGANRRPVLTLAPDYPLRAGIRESLTIEATDADEDPLTFRMVRGPSYASVITVEAGHGVGRGSIEVAPDSCARGDAACVVEVSDGLAADVDTITFRVHPIVRAIPASPMVESKTGLAPDGGKGSLADSTRLLGDWEWTGTTGGKGGFLAEPQAHGVRRRMVFHPGDRMELLEIGSDRILRSLTGTYRLVSDRDGARLDLSVWFEPLYIRAGASFSASMSGSSGLSVYPWHTFDAGTDFFVRVPRITREDGRVDSSGFIAPVEPPRVRFDRGRTHVDLSKVMNAALHRCDPDFRLWSEADSRALRHGLEKGPTGPSAIAGDFDGDLLPDVALLGRSGADQVVIAVLSHYGNVQAIEVAWRRVWIGDGENRSRGDPAGLAPAYLERASRGSLNPFCWTAGRTPLPLDGIGIVVPGVARFDYVLSDGRFLLHAPRP